jgi:DNA gyrase subunit A
LRVIGRGSAGVRLFTVSGDEHVVSAVRLDEEPEGETPVAPVGGEPTETPAAESPDASEDGE